MNLKKYFIVYSRKFFGIPPPNKRKEFSKKVKARVDRNQNYCCIVCDKVPRHKKYDHINKVSDASFDNCQMFCGDCHDDKTDAERKMRDRRIN